MNFGEFTYSSISFVLAIFAWKVPILVVCSLEPSESFSHFLSDDEVYMKDENLREEYVLNDTGTVYWGGRRPKYWNFAQVSIKILSQ